MIKTCEAAREFVLIFGTSVCRSTQFVMFLIASLLDQIPVN